MKSNRKQRSSLRNQNLVTRVAGRAFVAGSVANGTAVVITPYNLIPANLGNRIAAIASDYEYWRIRKLKVYQVIRNANGFPVHCLAFIPVPPAYFTAPTTFAQMVDFPSFQMRSTNAPSIATLKLGDRDLTTTTNNKERWLVTDSTGVTDTALYSSGIIYSGIFSSTADVSSALDVCIEVEVEFRSPIDPSLSLRFTHVVEDKKEEKKK
jgi:hypothetical protein